MKRYFFIIININDMMCAGRLLIYFYFIYFYYTRIYIIIIKNTIKSLAIRLFFLILILFIYIKNNKYILEIKKNIFPSDHLGRLIK